MRECEIFRGLDDDEYTEALKNIYDGEYTYPKNAMILHAGDITRSTGLVLEGSVSIESADMWGNTALLGIMGTGELFAVSYALLSEPMLVDVRANEDCRVIFLNVGNIYGAESWARKITRNILAITARKNLHLSERSFINANRSIRRKVMSLLNSIALKTHSRDITIPFDRQQMADYLNVDRSALSKELCAMRDNGVIEFHRNKFLLKI